MAWTSNLKILEMNLFDAPKGALLVHACNCMGRWGSGIAKVFAEKKSKAYVEYQHLCSRGVTPGMADILSENVGVLFTSKGYASTVDSPAQILTATRLAVNDLLAKCRSEGLSLVYSNKFNSGLFKVPWVDTEKVLAEVLSGYPEIEWVVCDYTG
jgi:ADP-ribose 1''-phosphate phosphatase